MHEFKCLHCGDRAVYRCLENCNEDLCRSCIKEHEDLHREQETDDCEEEAVYP